MNQRVAACSSLFLLAFTTPSFARPSYEVPPSDNTPTIRYFSAYTPVGSNEEKMTTTCDKDGYDGSITVDGFTKIWTIDGNEVSYGIYDDSTRRRLSAQVIDRSPGLTGSNTVYAAGAKELMKDPDELSQLVAGFQKKCDQIRKMAKDLQPGDSRQFGRERIGVTAQPQ